MKHKGTATLETERLVLRRFIMEDAEAMYRNWANDEKVTEYLRWPAHKDASVSEVILSDWISNYEKPDFYQWAIVLKDLGQPVGTISVVEMKEEFKTVHIGYCVGRKWWHQGITSEAFSKVIQFLFEEVEVNRIESQHDPANPNSGKVMQKCGLKYEGTLRQADFNNTGIVDASMYSLLRAEYRGIQLS